jgi:hypothetical protein
VGEAKNANREIGVPKAREKKEGFLGERRLGMAKNGRGDFFRNFFSLWVFIGYLQDCRSRRWPSSRVYEWNPTD